MKNTIKTLKMIMAVFAVVACIFTTAPSFAYGSPMRHSYGMHRSVGHSFNRGHYGRGHAFRGHYGRGHAFRGHYGRHHYSHRGYAFRGRGCSGRCFR